MNVVSEPMPPYGDLFTREEFSERVRLGLFINYDGTGYFATKDGMNRANRVDCSKLEFPEWATHVAWFNR